MESTRKQAAETFSAHPYNTVPQRRRRAVVAPPALASAMVCPYRLVTTAITATLSILYITKTTSPEQCAGAETGKTDDPASLKAGGRRWTPRTIALVIALVLLHVDLLVTGYLRAGVKDIIASVVGGR